MQMQCEQQAASAAVTDWERGGDITPAPRAISVYCTNLFLRRACLKKKISPAVCATRTDPLLIEAHELFARDYLSKYMSLSEDNFGLKYPKWYIPE
jgi:hypothetical protein